MKTITLVLAMIMAIVVIVALSSKPSYNEQRVQRIMNHERTLMQLDSMQHQVFMEHYQ